MDRAQVKKLHQDVNDALKRVAESHGFTYKPGTFRFSDLDVRSRIQFVLASKAVEYQNQNTITEHYSGLKAGDLVSLIGHPEKYNIVRFTTKGSAIIVLNRDYGTPSAKQYRCKVSYLSKAGAVAIPPVVTQIGIRTTETILNEFRDVENRLSPENLSCDGELPKTEQRRRYAELTKKRNALIAELGRVPTDTELWGLLK